MNEFSYVLQSLARAGRDLVAQAGWDLPKLRHLWGFAGKQATAFR